MSHKKGKQTNPTILIILEKKITIQSAPIRKHDQLTSRNSCMMPRSKSVSFTPSETTISYVDTLSLQERSELWCSAEDLRSYEEDMLESISIHRSSLNGKRSFLDPNEHCERGLEAYLETTILSNVREYYVDCFLELQDELFNVEDGGPGMDPTRREKLICAIKKLDSRETAKALKRASKDRSAADQIHEEDSERPRRSQRTTRLSFLKEPQLRIHCAKSA